MSMGGGAGTLGSASFQLLVDIHGLVAGMQQAQNAAAKGSEEIARKMSNVGGDMRNVGAAFTAGLTVPIVAGFAGIIKAGSDYESAFAGVRKTVEATEEQFQQLNTEIREMATTIPVTREELAGIGETAGQLGVEVEAIEKFIETSARLGVSTNLSAREAAEGFARLFNVMGESNESIGQFGAVLVDLGNNFATTEAEILAMATRMSSVMVSVGVATEDVMAFAAAMSSMGIETEAGSTAVSRGFIIMNKAISEGGEQLDKFAAAAGVTAEQFKAAWTKDPADAMELFFQGLNKLQKQGVDILPILEELNLNEIRLRRTMLAGAAGADLLTEARSRAGKQMVDQNALIEESNRRFETFASTIQILKNRLSDLGVELFESLRPMFISGLDIVDKFINVITGLVDAFTNLPKPVQETIALLAGLLAVVGPITAGVGMMMIALAPIGGIALGIVAGITALVAIGVILVKNFDEIKAAAVNAWGWMQENIPAIATIFEKAWWLIEGALNGWKEGFEDLFAVVVGAGSGIVKIIQGMVEMVIAGLEAVATVVVGLAKIFIASFEAIKERSMDPIKEVWAEMDAGIENAQKMAKDGLETLVDGAVEAFEGGRERLKQTEFGRAIGDMLNDAAMDVDHNVERMIRSWAKGETEFEGFYANVVAAYQQRGISIEELRNAVLAATTDEERFQAVLRETTKHTWENAEATERAGIAQGGMASNLQGLIQNLRILAAVSQDAAAEMVTWADAQEIMANAVTSSANAISHWESRGKDIENAMESIREEIERTGDPTGELGRQFDYLAGRYDRVTAGIVDDLLPAWRQQIINREKLQEVIEAENQILEENARAYEAGEYGQVGSAKALAEYNRINSESQQRIASTTEALEAQIDPQKELIGLQQDLADAFGTVIDKIYDLLVQMGAIPGDIKTDFQLTGLPEAMGGIAGFGDELAEVVPPSKETMILVDAAQAMGDIQRLMPWYRDIPEEVETEILVDDTDAEQKFWGVGKKKEEVEAAPTVAKIVSETTDAIEGFNDVLHAGMDLSAYKPVVKVAAQTQEAKDEVVEVEEVAKRTAAGSYTVRIKADISEALAGIYLISEYLPQSPAEKGPLAFTPSWDWVFDQLPKSAQYWTDGTLKILDQYINDTLAGVDHLGNELLYQLPAYARDAVAAMAGELVKINDIVPEVSGVTPDFKDPNAGPKKPGKKADLGASGTTEAVKEATKESKETAKAATTWEQEAEKAMNLVQKALDLLESLGEAAVIMGPDIRVKIATLVEFAGMVADEMRGVASGFGPAPEHAEDFFSFAGSSMTTMKAALDLLNSLSESVADFTRFRFDEHIATLKFIIEKAVVSLRDTAYLLGVEGLEDTNTFMESAGTAMTLMISALDFLERMSESVGNFERFYFDEHIATLKFIIEKAVVSLRDTSNAIGAMPPELNTFLESALKSMELMISALDLLERLSESSGDFERFKFDEHIATLKFLLEKAVVSLSDSAQVMREGYAEELKDFNEAAQESVGTMLAALDLLERLTDTTFDFADIGEDLSRKVMQLSIMSLVIAQWFSVMAEAWDGEVNDSINDLAEATSASSGALGDALGLLEALADTTFDFADFGEDLSRNIMQLSIMALVIAGSFQTVADGWDSEVNEGIEALSDAVSNSTGAMGDVLSLLEALSDTSLKSIPDANSMRGIGQKLAEVGKVLAQEMEVASREWDMEVNPALTAFGEAVSASTGAMGDVMNLLNMFQQEQDNVQKKIDSDGKTTTTVNVAKAVNHLAPAAQAKRIGETLAKAGLELANAINEAMQSWSGTGNESVASRIREFNEIVSDVTGGIGAIFSLLKDSEDLKTMNGRVTLLAVQRIIEIGLELGMALSEAGGKISNDSLAAAAKFVEWQSNVENVFGSLRSIMSGMPENERLAAEYRLSCERIAADILAGNTALESAGLDMQLSGPTVISQAAGPGAGMSTPAPTTPTVTTKDVHVHVEVDRDKLMHIVYDVVNEYYRKEY